MLAVEIAIGTNCFRLDLVAVVKAKGVGGVAEVVEAV